MTTHRVKGFAVLAVGALLGLSACGAGTAKPSGDEVSGELSVFAAASLTESFTTIGADFESAHDGTKITFNFAGSSDLANQINEGAPADVFASAAPANMATVVDAGNAHGDSETFARNQLVIAVAKSNPKHINELADLADPDLLVAVCAEQVPCGAAATTVLAAGEVSLTPATFEKDVKSALSKLALGEVDAALVYRTDALAASDKVDGIEFDESAEAVSDYPIAALKDAPNPATAKAFIDYVNSTAGRDVLAEAGFQNP